MEKICKNCGYHISPEITTCPFCGDNIERQDLLEQSYIITPKINDLFKEEKVNIKFNTRSIVNDVDAMLDPEYETLTLKTASKENQYLGADVTPQNMDRIDSILAFYHEEINNYRKKQKNELESMGISALQKIVADFNDVVNMCNKYKKMTNSKPLHLKIDNTIELYNKEIHYVKKYFILPLYDSEDLLAGSRMAKTFINVIGLLLGYFVLVKLPGITTVEQWITNLMTHATSGSEALRMGNLQSMISVAFAIWFTNIVFSFYISATIKNRNFQVDQGKSYEIILTFAIIGWAVSTYNQYIAIFYNVIIMLYIAYFAFINLTKKKRGLNWFIVRIATCLSVAMLLINLLTFMM